MVPIGTVPKNKVPKLENLTRNFFQTFGPYILKMTHEKEFSPVNSKLYGAFKKIK